MIEFKCSQCSKQLRVKDGAAGKRGKCPQCGAIIEVPCASSQQKAPMVKPNPLERRMMKGKWPMAQLGGSSINQAKSRWVRLV